MGRVPTSESDLAACAAAGDRDCLSALLGRVAPRLLRIAWNLCRDSAFAEDLCQEGLIKISDRRVLAKYEGLGSLDGYVISCATRAMISALRPAAIRGARTDASLDQLDERGAAPQAVADDMPESFDSGLVDAFKAIPERARVVVLLLTVGDLTYAETAEATGLPIGTVRSTYARARTSLRMELERSGTASD
jgi:RNA polymerase sigma factor (sigma-70 family)